MCMYSAGQTCHTLRAKHVTCAFQHACVLYWCLVDEVMQCGRNSAIKWHERTQACITTLLSWFAGVLLLSLFASLKRSAEAFGVPAALSNRGCCVHQRALTISVLAAKCSACVTPQS